MAKIDFFNVKFNKLESEHLIIKYKKSLMFNGQICFNFSTTEAITKTKIIYWNEQTEMWNNNNNNNNYFRIFVLVQVENIKNIIFTNQ